MVLYRAAGFLWGPNTSVSNDRLMTLFTGAVALFTLMLVGATIALYIGAARQLAQSADTAERQIRAYVTLEAGAILIGQAPNASFIEACVTLKNHGQSPAYACRAWMTVNVSPTANEAPFAQRGAAGSSGLLGPGASYDMSVRHVSSQQQIHGISQSTQMIYVWGRLEYLDAFQKQRHFEFRFYANGTPTTVRFKEITGPGWGLIPHPIGFEAN